MTRAWKCLPLAALSLLASVGCNDFLSGGPLSNDPNNPQTATNNQLFVATQTNLWAELGSDPPRIADLWAQQLIGTNIQYTNIYNYGVSEATTNGFHQGLYIQGGLVDIRKLEAGATAVGDSLYLGIAQVEEGLLMGTGADLFGDIVYSEALGGANPAPDPQLQVYDEVQAVLDQAIANLATPHASDVGPGAADLVYGGDRAAWEALAHTVKARFYLHTAEVRPDAYAKALAEAKLGITDPSGDYVAVFSGAAGEENFWYQFDVVQRAGYFAPNQFFTKLLTSLNDPRASLYFEPDFSDLCCTVGGNQVGRLAPDYHQPLVTAKENLLIWAEAAARTGAPAEALTQLNAERALWTDELTAAGQPALAPITGVSGTALLTAILTEKYIALFQTIEPWNDYKRTCWPNLTPTVAGRIIPARLFYDAGERQTDPNLLPPEQQPPRNANDPANATDPTGAACLGQRG